MITERKLQWIEADLARPNQSRDEHPNVDRETVRELIAEVRRLRALAGAAPEMARLLLWIARREGKGDCPVCGFTRQLGHDPAGCDLEDVLRDAGVLPHG